MKTKLFTILALIILAITGFIYHRTEGNKQSGAIHSAVQQNIGWQDKYYMGAVNCEMDYPNNYPNLDTLGFSLWHKYTNGEYSSQNRKFFPYLSWDDGSVTNDHLLTSVGDYAGALNTKINNIFNHNGGRKLIMMRPKIEYLCYGQRSDYECEPIAANNDLWFYSFNDHGSYPPETDSGKTVVHCRATQDDAGFVVNRLKANTEQCHRIDSGNGNEWQGDSFCDWLVKPRIRIDSTVAHSSQNPLVCKIIVIGQTGNDTLKNVDIFARYFLDNSENYNGRYIEEFNYHNDPVNLTIPHRDWGDLWAWKARGTCENDNGVENKSDIQVYWYGNCDMWIDYVRVDNDVADQLFKGYYEQPGRNWIHDEVTQIGVGKIMKYYIELVEFNNLPCIAYVDSLVKQYSGNTVDIMQDLSPTISVHVPDADKKRIENAQFLYHHYVQKTGFTQIFAEAYPFTACHTTNQGLQTFSEIPNTLPVTAYDDQHRILAQAVTPTVYDTYVQDDLNHKPFLSEEGGGYNPGCNDGILSQQPGYFRHTMQTCDSISKMANIPFIFMPQAHQWYKSGEVRREPTNEELNMLTNVAASYGAKGMLWFSYNSYYSNANDYGTGIAEAGGQLRTENYYGQTNPNKWETIKSIINRLSNKWGPYLISFNNADRHSYIYDDGTERTSFISNSYFADIYTYKPDISNLGQPMSNQENQNERYIQVASFRNTNEQFSRYFMITNRRCSPFYNFNGETGGIRFVKIQFDANSPDFANFNNWEIIDLKNDSTVLTFDKRVSTLLDLGWYMPGEGKLYKIVPVMVEGGTLDCDEEIGSGVSSFECKGEVIGNSKNIFIPNKVTISFHPAGKITMNGGQFTCGLNVRNRGDIIFQGTGNFYWDGFSLSNCTKVELLNCKFLKSPDAPPDTNDFKYSLKITNCKGINIENCDFIYTNAEYSGAIKIDYLQEVQDIDPVNIYGNIISTDISTAPALNIISYASNEMPFVIEYNEFTGSNNNINNNAMLLSNVTGGAVKNNTITNYLHSIIFYSSSIDFYNDSISCDREGAEGIMCFAYSQIHMDYAGDYKTGGNNSFTNYGNSSRNVDVSNSMFYIEDGYNSFDISSENSSYHLKGDFPSEEQIDCIKATQNCFKISSKPDTAYQDVTWGVYDPPNPVNFLFDPTDCTNQQDGDFIVFQLQNNIKDTIRKTNTATQSTTLNTLYDSININVRKNDYLRVIELGYSFLDNYPDSLESVDVIGKLYLAALVKDSSGSKIQPLKTYYENLIQNHSQNISLISRAYYLVQKCKVALKDYQSALTGFQNILNQNPYTYEGLLASWDYSATTLLMGSGGSLRNDIPVEEEISSETDENSGNEVFQSILNQMLDSLRKDRKTIINNNSDINRNKIDNNKFIITKNIENVFENNRKKTENRIKDLEKKIKSDNEKIRKDAVKELIQMKKLGEVIKVRNPKDIAEHIKFVNRDIKKVFGGSSTMNENKKTNIIPTDYVLYQNYPNPFNPVTKISFDLPKDSKVKLIVYDILGREVTRLLNSEFKTAGKYVVEFNAVNLNLASGVYFYRIETDKFIAVKKMLLIK